MSSAIVRVRGPYEAIKPPPSSYSVAAGPLSRGSLRELALPRVTRYLCAGRCPNPHSKRDGPSQGQYRVAHEAIVVSMVALRKLARLEVVVQVLWSTPAGRLL